MAESLTAVSAPVQAAPAFSAPETADAAQESHLGKRPHPVSSPGPGHKQQQQQNQKQQNGRGGGGGGGRPPRPFKKKFKGRKPKGAGDGSAEEVLLADIQSLLATLKLQDENEGPVEVAAESNGVAGSANGEAVEEEKEEELPAPGTEVELDVVDLSSTGDGLAVLHSEGEKPQRRRRRRRIYVVSFAVPGDVVRARIFRHLRSHDDDDDDDNNSTPTYSVADMLEVVRPSAALRDDSRVRCQYFGRCSGCQYQMLDYSEQLAVKRRVVERAYRHFSQLPPERVPAVLDTVASPLQYGYRTKLTPHFDGPPGTRRRNKAGHTLTAVPDIGFMQKGGARMTMDIEQCPIGTPVVAAGMARERARVARDFATYQRGATILLRESTQRFWKGKRGSGEGEGDTETKPGPPDETPADAVRVDTDAYTDIKTCITDHKATSVEYVDDYIFTNPAGCFFQNNNSILPTLTAYVRSQVRPAAAAAASSAGPPKKEIRYLIDAYSGSGLFTITLASTLPGGSIGIDIADQSIEYARANAALNQLAPERCRFLAADAAQLFAGVQALTYDPDETVVVLDPPRKGCDGPFLRQLLAFAPARIVYVSCNVHTQARDVGMLVRGEIDRFGPQQHQQHQKQQAAGGKPGARYEIESLRGFDFFPQTAHVEGIAVLNRVDERAE